MKNIVYFFLCQLILVNLLFAQSYVAPNGDDANPGTKEKPYGTFLKAISEVSPGDTIFVRGGIYNLINTITITVFIISSITETFISSPSYLPYLLYHHSLN